MPAEDESSAHMGCKDRRVRSFVRVLGIGWLVAFAAWLVTWTAVAAVVDVERYPLPAPIEKPAWPVSPPPSADPPTPSPTPTPAALP
jgi:hypothetical protein